MFQMINEIDTWSRGVAVCDERVEDQKVKTCLKMTEKQDLLIMYVKWMTGSVLCGSPLQKRVMAAASLEKRTISMHPER
jgi:hypothetical protein